MIKLIILATAIVFTVSGSALSSEQLIGADLIVFNAKITTGNLTKPKASALAVKRGRIYAVGADSETLALSGSPV